MSRAPDYGKSDRIDNSNQRYPWLAAGLLDQEANDRLFMLETGLSFVSLYLVELVKGLFLCALCVGKHQ